MNVVKFPESVDFGGFNEAFLEALAAHHDYIENETKRLPTLYERSKSAPEWFVKGKEGEVISVWLQEKPDAAGKKVCVDSLIGYATYLGKRIRRAWRGEHEGHWVLGAELKDG